MSFTSKNLQSVKRRGMTFFKGATLFFLGMSVVLFTTKAFIIEPITRNVSQVIQKILFTNNGDVSGATGVYIDGSGGNAYFAGTVTTNEVCLSSDCRTSRPVGTLPQGNDNTIQFKDGTNFSGNNYFVRDNANGYLGIGTNTPTEKVSINVNGTDSIVIGDQNSDNMPMIASNSGLVLRAGVGATLDLASNMVKIGNGMYVWGGIMGGGTANRVGINTSTQPAEALYVNGKSQMGDNLKLYSSTYDGIIQTDDTSKMMFNTNGTNTRMTIDASGDVGINVSDPQAKLDVLGAMKILSSMTGKSYTSGIVRYFPQGVLTGSLNTGLSGDSIRYLMCNDSTMTGGLILLGLTGSNVAIQGFFENVYFILPGMGTLTYHLKAGETFAVVPGCTNSLVAYKQEYGKQINNVISGGGTIHINTGIIADVSALQSIVMPN